MTVFMCPMYRWHCPTVTVLQKALIPSMNSYVFWSRLDLSSDELLFNSCHMFSTGFVSLRRSGLPVDCLFSIELVDNFGTGFGIIVYTNQCPSGYTSLMKGVRDFFKIETKGAPSTFLQICTSPQLIPPQACTLMECMDLGLYLGYCPLL